MDNNTIIDIETIPGDDIEQFMPGREEIKYGNIKDEAKREKKYQEVCQGVRDKAALNAHTGQVVLIGAYHSDNVFFYEGDEYVMLVDFWQDMEMRLIEKTPNFIVGHNILNFDIPFIIRRSFVLGIKVPDYFIAQISSYRSDIFRDTMRMWFFGSKNEYIKLGLLAKIFGIPMVDNGVTGEFFYKWWAKNKQACRDYCRSDVEATRAIFDKMDMGV